MAWNGVITNAGANLIAQWAQNVCIMRIRGAYVGNATVLASNLYSQTEVECDGMDAQAATVISYTKVASGTRFKVMVSPGQTAYTAKMIGIYARLSTQSSSTLDTLLCVVQDSTGVAIPAASTDPDFAFTLYVNTSIDNTGQLSITVDTSTYATVGDIDDAIDALNLQEASTKTVANSVTVDSAGTSVLDAYQGKVLKDLIDALCVQPGTYTLTYAGAGYITSGKQQVMVTIPISKVINGVIPSSVSCDALEIRQDGNYLWQTSEGLSELEIVPNTAANPLRSGLTLNLYRSRGGSHIAISDNAVNNAVVGIYIRCTVTWTASS